MRENSTVTINGVEVAAYKQWGAPSYVYPTHGIQVVTVQPGPAVSTGPIVVTVGGKVSNTDHTFTVRSGDIYFLDNSIPDGRDGNGDGEIGNINKPFRYLQQTYDIADFDAGDFMVIRAGRPPGTT